MPSFDLAMALKCVGRLRPVLQRLRCTATSGILKTSLVVPQQDHHITLLSRHLATKSSKGKTKGPARVNINTALVEDIINLKDIEQDMKNVVDSLKEDFSKSLSIRTSPGAFDHIVVKTKDGKFPLSHLGQITLKSPRLFVINMASFPESADAVVNALRQSQMNLNPELDGTIIRVPVPPVTREHRENLTKLAKQLTNKAKESLRKIRSGAVQDVKKFKTTVSEDTIKLIEKQIQQMADDVSAEMDKQLASKTKELLE
ncbi:ribosome-recycling factor, mitochondrial isoform X1 [Bufo gargarizans]|uniref:ribosome-recycling factor, mitochondrial isoform X1 n=2 Tax=Bufo gargarizans TaxID=30331 RepID=UPI001CF28878|nr:ribosome-recycling factor, mitochondrial isoform X1 [Bufo gargarizans]